MPVVLWTDALIYVLLLGIGLVTLITLRHAHLRAPWRKVLRSRLGMAAAIVLLAYVVVGVLDSFHYRPRLEGSGHGGQPVQYSGVVLSVLDRLLTPLRTSVEKSYSAPFALHLYQMESVRLPDGSHERRYPRLAFGGAHLDSEEERLADIAWTVSRGLLEAAALWLLVVMLLAFLLGRRAGGGLRSGAVRLMQDPEIPWGTILLTFGILLALILVLVRLGGAYHVLGTDKVGQDVLYLSLKSVRTGLVIGTLTTLVMLPFALLLGIAAGYLRGWVDDVIQYLYTTLNSIPSVLLIAAAILMVQVYMASHAETLENLAERADLRLLSLCVILGITSWTGLCRLLRGETLKLREVEYVQAAQALGVGSLTIIHRHLLPNVMHIVLITVVLDFSGLVLAEAVLSYVNIGVDPTTNSWGNMINAARLEMAREPIVWWSLAAAFLFMFTLVLAANLFADAVRDAFDPRVR